jgi:membrane associated rhomboid family serine protease
MVGASGAIAGVMGGYLLMFPRARIDVLVIIIFLIKIFTIPAWLMLGIWFGLQLVNGLAMDVAGGGVAYWAHAGGFVAGVLAGAAGVPAARGTAYWAATHGKPPHEEVEYVVSRSRRSPVPSVRRVRSAT